MVKAMTKQDLENWLVSRGYSKDKYGNYQKNKDGKVYRYKLQATSVRYEVQITLTDWNDKPKHEWLRIKSGYYKNLSLNPETKLLCGLR